MPLFSGLCAAAQGPARPLDSDIAMINVAAIRMQQFGVTFTRPR
jgi:hypothetical protein